MGANRLADALIRHPTAARAVHSMRPRFRNGLGSYVIAAALVGATLALRLGLSMVVGEASAFLLFLAAVMVAAWLGGTGPALFATVLSTIAANYFFMYPLWSFGLGNPTQQVEAVLFLAQGVVVTLLVRSLHKATEAALAGQVEARELEAKILSISDEERRRIGHDLHDGLGQHLTGVAFLSKVLSQRLAAKELPGAADAQLIAELVNESIGWTRDLARGLSPVSVEGAGLGPAIVDLAARNASVFGLSIDCEIDPDLPVFEDSVAIHLYHIVQEAISNAAKHARAKKIEIEFRHSSEKTVLKIVNDGLPFTVPGEDNPGMGLRIMRYRARMIGGELEIESLSGQRTLLTCSIPAIVRQTSTLS